MYLNSAGGDVFVNVSFVGWYMLLYRKKLDVADVSEVQLDSQEAEHFE